MSCLRILKLRELVQNVCHLVSTLSTSDIYNYVCLCPLGKLVLDNCLTASERSRNCGNTTLCNREEGIYYSLSCNKRHYRWDLLYIWTSSTNRPFLHKGKLSVTLVCGNYTYHLINGEVSCLDLLDSSLYTIRDHDLLGNNHSLLNRTYYVSGCNLIADLGNRDKRPLDISL